MKATLSNLSGAFSWLSPSSENNPGNTSSKRLESLDWLRGLMAFSIMLYHYGADEDAATALGRLGIYGVSIFFILSGLSMAIAYDRYIHDFKSSFRFFVRRLFRILPLLWLAIALLVVPMLFLGKAEFGQEPYTLTTIWLNISTLFGFFAPSQYINVGAWSIGNEMVYYALTPILIWAFHQSTSAGNMVTISSVLIGVFFSFVLLDPNDDLANQWAIYVNPFNNFFLYCVGLAMYYNLHSFVYIEKWKFIILLSLIAAFFYYPVSGDQINLVTGFNRVVMSALSIAIVFAFYKNALVLPKFLGVGLEKLGVATYGVYLLHPLVIDYTRGIFTMAGWPMGQWLPVIAAFLTIGFALATYKYLEAPLTNLGKRMTRNNSIPLPQSDRVL